MIYPFDLRDYAVEEMMRQDDLEMKLSCVDHLCLIGIVGMETVVVPNRYDEHLDLFRIDGRKVDPEFVLCKLRRVDDHKDFERRLRRESEPFREE